MQRSTTTPPSAEVTAVCPSRRRSVGRVLLLTAAAGLGFMATGAGAHPLDGTGGTGAELRSPADCGKLSPPLRGHCLACVTRPRPHHFHPEAAPGARCQADGAGGARATGATGAVERP